ncbi:probable ADP-ribosylation factor GTPase-activating protein AGD8 isoform X2 [Cryptomeria japonica]|nr:probable ADP-ribosylation factor GTPase-activating protein AGD8 isoform X2 [Cryptomeria japonica]
MSFGGNGRGHTFFKQHGWTDGGKIEAKYTSRAAELYRQLLAKEVAKSVSNGTNHLSSSLPNASQANHEANGFPGEKISTSTNDFFFDQQLASPEVTPSKPEVCPSYPAMTNTAKKPLGARRTVGNKTGGLGVKKLTTKPNENLYDQKPEEPTPTHIPSTTTTAAPSASRPSRFSYLENNTDKESNGGGNHISGHVPPPASTNFFAEFGMNAGNQKKTNASRSKLQIEESNEARQKFADAKSISSSQFFGEQNKAGDPETKVRLQKFSGSTGISSDQFFGHDEDDSPLDLTASELITRLSFQASQDMSTIKNIAGETGKKLTSLASNIFADLQDRVL